MDAGTAATACACLMARVARAALLFASMMASLDGTEPEAEFAAAGM